ncbi:MAG TPA: hypothetical protein VG206_24950 [Terriglobia bacterium]|nr:hypothetical protein [Terriglobia bacterium]
MYAIAADAACVFLALAASAFLFLICVAGLALKEVFALAGRALSGWLRARGAAPQGSRDLVLWRLSRR